VTGTLAQYDDLCEALEAYEAAPCPSQGWKPRFGRLALCAFRCGKPDGVATLPWALRRRETYRATVTGAVSHLQSVIEELVYDQSH
jgi:hypothetical protein